jgi:uncharacterized protein
MLVEISDRPERSRFEVHADGEFAGLATYRRNGDHITFSHTETKPRFTGRGLATKLIKVALDDSRERGLGVLPHCSFVRDFIDRNPEYLDLVPADQRARFNLPNA